MSQILHIFRKDARHHWPEVLLSIALLATFVAEQPHKWTGLSYSTRFLNGLVSALPAIMILAWAFLIIRLVQSETLVGNRQFWITRPYEWHKLLAAKLLSVAVFIHIPLFVAQLVLLKIAEFPILSSLAGLLFLHALLFIAITLPSLTVATITAGIGQAALAILAAFVAFVALASVLFTQLKMDTAADATNSPVGAIYISASVIVILLQYMYRRTRWSWVIFGGALTLITLIMLLAPYERIINGWFPPAGNAHPVPARFEFNRKLTFAHSVEKSLGTYGDDVELEFPFEISDLEGRPLIDIRAIKLDLDLPDGTQWTSRWHSVYNRSIISGRTRVWPNIAVNKGLFNRVKDVPVRGHISLGLNVYRMGPASEVVLAGDRVKLPGGARCLNVISENLMHCFSALKAPGPIFVAAELPNLECPITNDAIQEPWASSPAFFVSLSADSTPDLELTPIQQFDLDLSRYFIYEELRSNLPICSGTRLLVNQPQFLDNVGENIDLGEINLADYHSSYPRRIVPRLQRPKIGEPSDTLSDNFSPELLQKTKRPL